MVADFGAFSVPTDAVIERLGALQRCTGATAKQLADMLGESPTLLEMDSDLVTYIARSLRGAVPPCTPPPIDLQASLQEHNRSRFSVKHDLRPRGAGGFLLAQRLTVSSLNTDCIRLSTSVLVP